MTVIIIIVQVNGGIYGRMRIFSLRELTYVPAYLLCSVWELTKLRIYTHRQIPTYYTKDHI